VSPTRKKHVVIIGAGIGGLTLAIALARRGFRVSVHEQAAALGELGAGLTVSAGAMRVFNELGLWEQVRDITVRSTGMTFVHYKTGAILEGTPDHEWTRRPTSLDHGGQTHRAMLHGLLVDALKAVAPDAIALGRRLKSFRQDEKGVTAGFENGDEVEGDLLVACDGLRSIGYRLILGAENPATFTGVVAIRCMVPRDRAEPYITGGRSMKYVGPGLGFSRYGVRDGSLINCIALARTDAWLSEGWTHACSRDEFLDLYKDFHHDVLGLIENAPTANIFKWALYDRDPLTTWTSGRATLLGDAAHPMLPYLAQGAAAAIEDAMVLARALESYDDYADAFRRYEAVRLPRTSDQMLISRAQGDALNQPDPDAYKTLRPSPAKIFAYDPVTVPV
jgi:salicylate hydroxylase